MTGVLRIAGFLALAALTSVVVLFASSPAGWDIRHDDIDTEQFVVRKHDAGIDDNDRTSGTECHHMHSKFAKTAQRHYVERLIRHWS